MASKYIIKNATVISVDKTIGNVSDCDVLIEDGLIKAVGPNLEHSSDHVVIDGTDSIVSPGFLDTHRHAWQAQLRTICSDYVLTDYVLSMRHIYGSCYSPEDVYIANYTGALESIDNGITYMIDHSHIMNSPEHADAAIKGLRDAKIGGTFCYGLYPNPPWEGSNVDAEREETTPKWRFEDAKWVRQQHFPSNGPEELLRFGIALSEAEALPWDELVHEIKMGRSFGSAIITGHVALGKYDPGAFTTRKLDEQNLLGSDLLWSHANSMTPDELDTAKKYGMGLSATPDVELQMGVGLPVAFAAKDHGCSIGLGNDISSNNPADMFQQMRLLLQVQRFHEQSKSPRFPTKMSRICSEVLEMATQGGANAVGLGKITGSITPGKRADVIITKCTSTRLVPIHDPVAALVLYANASDIDTVFVNGEILKSQGKLAGVDWPKLRAELRESAESIMKMSKKAPREYLERSRDAMVQSFTERD
ncbi:hypothetical protein ACHAPI_007102 [Fusarium lateritium]